MSRPNDWSRALVTGASAGIGRSFAKHLAAEGSDLVVVARTEPQLKDLATELEDRHGVSVEVLAADLTVEDELARVELRLRDQDRPVDLLINNAGFGTHGRFHELDVETEESQIRLNVIALVRLTHAALAAMVARGRGGVVNVASLGAFQPDPFFATYGATKSFVLSFTEAVANELRTSPVTVSCVAPGLTRTEFQDRAEVETGGVPGTLWQSPEDVVTAALNGVASGRTVIVPGGLNRVTAAVSRVTPTAITRRIAAGLVKRRT
ncbi:MAG: SDR family oxidoreductase [Actinobacteria bacterium]|nr:SDR family oxidoreductase [Actinomycetota bacterium]